MATLTDRRLEAIRPILEEYRAQLFKSRRFNATALEVDLKAALGMGYQQLKVIARDLLKHERYQAVAAYYMHHNPGGGVPIEFMLPLAKLYGARRFDHDGMNGLQDEWWERVLTSEQKSE